MVNLSTVSDSELRCLIDDYPWFAAARCEYALRTGDDMKREGIFLISRSEWRQMTGRKAEGRNAVRTSVKPQYYVAGGDYFTKDDFRELQESGLAFDAPVFTPGATGEVPAAEIDKDIAIDELCTETLAGIYAQQEFYQRAIEVYEKLILLYPEKSVYFASLIEKLKNSKLS
ncbi:MAG: hypothetical protein KBS38_04110 [Bacteroidales bacterium]|nr:hypothetical protein [Candidatus Cacconaster caballi]